jgi:hypothetical protein
VTSEDRGSVPSGANEARAGNARTEFPFRVSPHGCESTYLTWIRNHANYMAVRGWSDYFRAVAVLLGGAFVNYFVIVPVLLVVAVFVAGLDVLATDPLDKQLRNDFPFAITCALLTLAAVLLVSRPARSLLTRIAGYRRSQDTGSDSSVKQRDRRERFLGGLLALIVAAALFESLVWLLPRFHALLDTGSDQQAQGLLELLPAPLKVLIGVGTALITGAERILKRVPRAAKGLIAAGIAALGLSAPGTIILVVADWLRYEKSSRLLLVNRLEELAWVPFIAALVLLLGIAWGLVSRAFSKRGALKMASLLVVAFGLVFVVKGPWEQLAHHLVPANPRSALDYYPAKALVTLEVAFVLWAFSWLTVDINQTSIHALYRDRLASTFLVGQDTEGDVDIEKDLDLAELSCHESGSTAPYHLINVALNLQGSSDIGVRDRRSDFFIFSKRFIGGDRTGYCSSESMERVFPQMSLASAMAISAAAASPNMGRETRPAMVALMTLFNIRLGVWVPNPRHLHDAFEREPEARQARGWFGSRSAPPRGLPFSEVFDAELGEVERRWAQLARPTERRLAERRQPSVEHGLVGLALSGGGIRSASVSLGALQALDRRGVFEHVDYMSTVSGGGYVGSSISALMRRGTPTESEVAGLVSLRQEAGSVIVSVMPDERGVRRGASRAAGPREYRYAEDAPLAVADGQRVSVGQRLVRGEPAHVKNSGFWRKNWQRRSFEEAFGWRVRPKALLWEMRGRLDEDRRWVNVSDGGHIENLGAIELLRRRCKYLILCDGEQDIEHRFGSLATLIRTARLDLGVHIDIDVDGLRLRDRYTSRHWAMGRVVYPPRPGESESSEEQGYVLYLKSSLTGDEDEVIREYRAKNSDFPHESTADQMFDEAQFEAYRSLGQHIAEQALEQLESRSGVTTFAEVERWLTELAGARAEAAAAGGASNLVWAAKRRRARGAARG